MFPQNYQNHYPSTEGDYRVGQHVYLVDGDGRRIGIAEILEVLGKDALRVLLCTGVHNHYADDLADQPPDLFDPETVLYVDREDVRPIVQ